jgi:lysozyme
MLSDQGVQIASEWLLNDEEYRQFPYDDATGKAPTIITEGLLTIGIGFNLSQVGLSLTESFLILRHRITLLDSALAAKLELYKTLSEPRQIALINMAYNVGIEGLLAFHDTLQALDVGEYLIASKAVMESKAAIDDHYRYERISQTLLTGKVPDAFATNSSSSTL